MPTIQFNSASKLAKHTPKRPNRTVERMQRRYQGSNHVNQNMNNRMNPLQRPGGIPCQRPRYRGRHPHSSSREMNLQRAQDAQYTWQGFQMDEHRRTLPKLITHPLNVSPPKPIQTIRLEPSTPAVSSAPGTSTTTNFCASWLAKNQSMVRAKRVEEIVVDDREEIVLNEEKEDDEIVVIEEEDSKEGILKNPVEPVKKATPVEKKDFRKSLFKKEDLDDSIVVLGEFPGEQKDKNNSSNNCSKKKMTQLEENKMNDAFWTSKPTSSSSSSTAPTSSAANSSMPSSSIPLTHTLFKSSSATSTVIDTSIPPPSIMNRPLMKILDGFSKDCAAYKRVVRRWNKVKVIPRFYENSRIPSSKFTVCSYNVLCQKTIARTNYLYRHLNNEPIYLEWDHRWKGLQEELPTFDADILGLQEVQCDHFFMDFEPFMKKHGYDGIYKQKHGTEQKDDGCAIFFRPSKFERVGYKEVNYFISPVAISNRENIAQILALRCRITGEVILVANTHLLFNEERGDVKLAQLAILFASIQEMQAEFGVSTDYKESIPSVLIMGDFNMEPNSKIYDFVVNGKLHIEGLPVRTLSGQSFRPGGKVCRAAEILFETTIGMTNSRNKPILDGFIRHPFKLSSAYHYSPDPIVIPQSQRCISTFHKDAAAPDFIFYSNNVTGNGTEKLQLLERFELPTLNTLEHAKPWPNKNVPSDHLPILVKFELTKDTD